jgi:hypothetical protein
VRHSRSAVGYGLARTALYTSPTCFSVIGRFDGADKLRRLAARTSGLDARAQFRIGAAKLFTLNSWPAPWSSSLLTAACRARPGADAWPRTRLKLWRRDMWCIPQVDGEYVALPSRPIPSARWFGFDESPIQLIGEVRQPFRQHRASSNATTTSSVATAPSICSLCST